MNKFIILIIFTLGIKSLIFAQKETPTFDQNFFETDQQFADRVTRYFFLRMINDTELSFQLSGSFRYREEKPYYITEIQGIYADFVLPSIGINGNANKFEKIRFTILVYDSNGILIGENFKEEKLNNFSSSLPIIIDGIGNNERELYSKITVIAKINEKIVFRRKDYVANFAFGTSNYDIINGRYCMTNISLEEGLRRGPTERNKSFRFRIEY